MFVGAPGSPGHLVPVTKIAEQLVCLMLLTAERLLLSVCPYVCTHTHKDITSTFHILSRPRTPTYPKASGDLSLLSIMYSIKGCAFTALFIFLSPE